MMLDKDLSSIQEARDLVRAGARGLENLEPRLPGRRGPGVRGHGRSRLPGLRAPGPHGLEETGYGVAAHKKLKNEFGSRRVWESIRDLKTVG